jgi:hypothetical protein
MPKTISGSKKILIIEYYLFHKNTCFKKLAIDLNLNYSTLTKLVRMYEFEKLLVLPSKIN